MRPFWTVTGKKGQRTARRVDRGVGKMSRRAELSQYSNDIRDITDDRTKNRRDSAWKMENYSPSTVEVGLPFWRTGPSHSMSKKLEQSGVSDQGYVQRK